MGASHMLQPLYSATGLAVGVLVGLTGVGGGSLMTPLLILLFGIHPATAVGTDLLYAAATKTVGSAVHGFNRSIDWRVVRRLATGSVPMTVVAILALSQVGINSPMVRETITAVLTIALLVTAGALVFRETIVARYAATVSAMPERQIAIVTVMVGAVLGVLVSITSVGAGAIGVTALICFTQNFRPCELSARILRTPFRSCSRRASAIGFLGLSMSTFWFRCSSARCRELSSAATPRYASPRPHFAWCLPERL